jgi:hypothetical protein
LPNFCPDCGKKLESPNPNFCPNCGKALVPPEIRKKAPPEMRTDTKTSIHELGTKLEECVEIILKKGMGFQTERRKKIKGKVSGVLHEIDVIARKGDICWAVECKNLKSRVGKELIQKFHSTLQDLGPKWNGIFISYKGFTQPAEEFAEQFNIKRWDPERLKEEWFAVSIGRAEYATLGKKKTVKNALPLNFNFSEASKVGLVNKDKIIVTGMLSYTPYFVIDYSYSARYKDPTKQSHKFKDSGKVVVSALDCSVLNPSKRSSTVTRTLKLVLSKEARQTAKRTTTLLQEIFDGVSDKEYDVEGENRYTVRILEPVITPRAAKKETIDFVTAENTETIRYRTQDGNLNSVTYTPKRRNINIKSVTLVNVPRWDITFNVFNRTYSREMLAYSGTVLEDSIQYCPKHIGPFKKETVAACEICGQALCEKHVFQCPTCGKWLCEEDGTFCASCGRIFCHDHISLFCGVCSKPLCSDCKVTCPSCGKIFGQKHVVSCSECGKEVCSDCVITVGRIRRKRLCKECAQ